MNEEEKKAIENLKREYEKLIKEDNILFPLYKSNAKRLINLIDKQNKVIDEMAQELIDMQIRQLTGTDLFRFKNKEDTKQYFIRKVENDEGDIDEKI